MKKTYKSITGFILLLSLVAFQMGAQISGTVTINSTLPTGGTNYQTFAALAATLNTSGVSGPLTVNVAPGTGPYVEQPMFNVITGVSATNTITINGNSNVLSFNSTNFAMPFTLLLNGADRLNFYNLNILGQGPIYALACLLSNGADYNNFSTCTFSCPLNGTSTFQVPFAISSSTTSATGGINSGNFNSVSSSTMSNGYYGVYMYGLTGAPYQTDNKVMNCLIEDFYQYGMYFPYQKNALVRGNIIQRPTRTLSTTTYGMGGWFNQGTIVEGNKIQRLFDNNQTSTSLCYAMFIYYNSVGGGANRNTIRNNIISDIKHNGTLYGIYCYYLDGDVYHNTISFDHLTSTATGVTWGLYPYGGPGYSVDVRNNNISITRGGTGTKTANYIALTGNITCNYNNYYVNSAGGVNNVGYYGVNAPNLAALQALGIDGNSFSTDPLFTSIPALNYIPTAASLNNGGTPVGVALDVANLPRSGTTPDIGAHEFLSIQCAGTPSANAVAAPTLAICPGENVGITVANYYSDLGITYQWRSSTTSSVGPFTSISGATSIQYVAPNVVTPTWYSVIMTCANGGGTIAPVGYVNVAGTTTNSVPYFEGFEGINKTNQLPNCSWSSTDLGGSTLTYTSSNTLGRTARTGTKFASFQYLPAGADYYFTNGIRLEAGITYSAALWFQTEYYGYNTWTNMSILLNTTQSATGASTLASTNGPAISNIYKSLSGTFTVATSGLYYVGIQGISANICCANYLNWDDLSITIPCSLNSPTMALVANTTSVCAGEQLSLNATGADTYSWNTGASTAAIIENPVNSTLYTVVGTSSLTGCQTTLTQMVTVNPAPSVFLYANNLTVCSGQSTNLSAVGANSYTWSNGAFTPVITVSPLVATNYTVIGSNAFGCKSSVVQAIAVNPLPTVAVNSSAPNDMCKGEVQTLTATGGVTYQWTSNTSGVVMQGNAVSISPSSTTIYTVTGTNANGCSAKATIVQNVNECVGLKTNSINDVRIYPNPTAGEFTVELNNASEKTVQVIDVTGRVISASTSSQAVVKVNVSNLANGIYYVKIQSDSSVEVVKVVKQ